MNTRKLVTLGALLAAATIGTCAYQRQPPQNLGGVSTPAASSLPVPQPTPGFVPLHPVRPAPSSQASRFGLVTSIEQDLDVTWTYEERSDGRHLVALDMRFKPNQFGSEPQMPAMPDLDPTHPRARFPRGQLLTLTRVGTQRSYQIIGSNNNYFGSLDERMEDNPTFHLYEDPSARSPFSTYLRTFEFKPNERRDQAPKKVY